MEETQGAGLLQGELPQVDERQGAPLEPEKPALRGLPPVVEERLEAMEERARQAALEPELLPLWQLL